jgi:vacuolar protein sorting-associated protein 18
VNPQTPQQRDVILSRQADHFFELGKFMQAAQTYAKSSRSFEYVTLRFVDADERDGLRVYLADRLHALDKTVSDETSSARVSTRE